VVTEQLSMPFGTMLPFTQTYGGENSYQHPTLGNPSKKRFASYDRSDVTTLDYAVNRFYSSQQGRFTQVDPSEMDAASLSNPQTLNLYAYCGNDPINNIDPDGLSFLGAIGSIFKAIDKAILSRFTSGSSASSGPDFRTPPTFPGSLPGINAAERSGMGGFRTPPFNPGASGFLAQQQGGGGSGEGWIDKIYIFIFGREAYDKVQRNIKRTYQELRARFCEMGFDCEQISKLSDRQIWDLYLAVQDGKTTFTTDGGIYNIVLAGQPPGGAAPAPPNKKIEDILLPGGKPLGQAGSKEAIRVLKGGMNEAQSLFDELTQGGKVVSSPTYPGTLVRLPNGGTVGLRTVMSNSPGTAANIDVNISRIPITKIKFNP
jgi:RHS repeat-associated protein